jgi:hypothetical protein
MQLRNSPFDRIHRSVKKRILTEKGRIAALAPSFGGVFDARLISHSGNFGGNFESVIYYSLSNIQVGTRRANRGLTGND